MFKKFKFYTLICFFYLMLFSPVYAYLDPGTFSIVVQSILAAIAGIGATYRLWISKIKNIFKKKKKLINECEPRILS